MADSSIYELTQKWCESQNRSIYSLYKNEDGLLKESTFESIKKGNNPEYETLKIIANEMSKEGVLTEEALTNIGEKGIICAGPLYTHGIMRERSPWIIRKTKNDTSET